MTTKKIEKETSSSDTLERSNLSSLQTDLSSTRKTLKKISNNDNPDNITNCFCKYAPDNIEMFQCPALTNYDARQYQMCYCQQFKLNPNGIRKHSENERTDWQQMNCKWPRRNYVQKKESYKRDSVHFKPCYGAPEGIPHYNDISASEKQSTDVRNSKPEKIEIYYFNHGNSAYYTTTDIPPILATDKYSTDIEMTFRQFWAELFGLLHIGLSFLTTPFMQMLRCVLYSLIRPITVGSIQLVADYFVKPLLSILFNGLIQPFFIVFYNMATSFRDCCEPLAATLGFFLRELAVLLKSCRLIETVRETKNDVA